jgi:hypothetical protein
MCLGGSSNTAALTAQQQQTQAALTQGGQNIENAFSSYTPAYYAGVQKNYENAALPQLFKQYRATGANVNYNMANRGLTNSSAAQQLGSSLQGELASQEQGVVNAGQQQAQQVQQQVASEKGQLYNQLDVTQNPTLVGQSALNTAAQTGAPSVFQPLGNLFSNWSNIYLANSFANNATTANPALTSPWLYNNPNISGKAVAASNYGG